MFPEHVKNEGGRPKPVYEKLVKADDVLKKAEKATKVCLDRDGNHNARTGAIVAQAKRDMGEAQALIFKLALLVITRRLWWQHVHTSRWRRTIELY